MLLLLSLLLPLLPLQDGLWQLCDVPKILRDHASRDLTGVEKLNSFTAKNFAEVKPFRICVHFGKQAYWVYGHEQTIKFDRNVTWRSHSGPDAAWQTVLDRIAAQGI